MTPARRTRRREEGLALLTVVFLVLLLGGLSLGVLEEGIATRTSLRHHEGNLRSLEVLEVGLVRSEMEIRALSDPDGDGIGTVRAQHAGGDFDVVAAQDAALPDRWTVTARGTHGLSTRRVETCFRRRARRMFVEGLFSRAGLRFDGTTRTDAYDSSLGTYASQAVNLDAGGAYARGGGDVGSNGPVRFTGTSVWVRGDAIPGPLQELQTSGQPTILGDRAPREMEIPLDSTPESEFQAALQANDNDVLVRGARRGGASYTYDARDMSLVVRDTLTLRSGTYFFSSLDLIGQATLRFEGTVRLYVTQRLDLTGGSVVYTGRPQDLLVKAHPYALPAGVFPSSTLVRLRGGSDTVMALYAPDAQVEVGGGANVYGSIVAGEARVLGDAAFHYDLSLAQYGVEGVATVERLYWREPSPPRR